MNIELKGRKAIITGSTAGIGRATAEGLARAGASVVINGRGNTRVDEAVRQMRHAFPKSDISGIAADLATTEGAEALIAQAPDADILVNNVGTAHIRGYSGVEDIAKIPDEDWLGLFQLNVMSGVRVTRHYLPRMVAKGWGRVVFVSSESAVNVPKEMIDYGMTKTAQLAMHEGALDRVAAAVPGRARCAADVDVGAPPQPQRAGREPPQVARAIEELPHPLPVLEPVAQLDELAWAGRAGERGQKPDRGLVPGQRGRCGDHESSRSKSAGPRPPAAGPRRW